MKTSFECVACLAKEAVRIADDYNGDEVTKEKILRSCLRILSESSYELSSPGIGYLMHTEAKKISSITDPYEELKAFSNKISSEIHDHILNEQWIENAENPFNMACRVAIAGNIIDYSAGIEVNFTEVMKSVKDSLNHELFGDDTNLLYQRIQSAKSILYLTDNAGEVFFDRFLLSQIDKEKLTLAVKGGPIVNDATLIDAEAAHLQSLVKSIIETGHDSQGVMLDYCSPEFKQKFNEADLIISKGMANFETLYDQTDKEIFFLFRAKCNRIATVVGCNKMDYVILRRNRL